jgi:hypothetical protein
MPENNCTTTAPLKNKSAALADLTPIYMGYHGANPHI